MIQTLQKFIYIVGFSFGVILWFGLFFLLIFDPMKETHINGIPLEETTCWTSTNLRLKLNKKGKQ
tara:strand:+ start:16 stop:210 length:195 start_codon:yes stop_codon:yes gene_type:complete